MTKKAPRFHEYHSKLKLQAGQHILSVAHPYRNGRSDLSFANSVILAFAPRDGLAFAVYYPGPHGHRVRYHIMLDDAMQYAAEQIAAINEGVA